MDLHFARNRSLSVNFHDVGANRLGQMVFKGLKTFGRNLILPVIMIAMVNGMAIPPVFAGGGDVCMVDRYNDVHGTALDSLNCTANDVSLAIYESEDGVTSCVEGETILVKLKGDFESTAATRWDVGVFISEDTNDPNTTGGVCYTDFLHPVSVDNTDLDLIGGAGPYYNGELGTDPTDYCGDIQSGAPVSFITDWVSIQCQDTDGDNLADVNTCTVWANAASDGSANKPSCQDESDVSADSSPKCTCSSVNIIGLDYLEVGQIEVVKELIPSDDNGLFNLWVDDSELALDVGHDGTTGIVIVGAGTSEQPNETHAVRETAGTGTSLDSYIASISCVDRGLTTFDGGPPLTQAGSGPIDVLVNPDDDIVCTITNTSVCASAVCEDSACATYACDPTGAPGNCDIMTPRVEGTECRASGGICDVAEVCDGSSPLCPGDMVEPDTTECRPAADTCDIAEYCDGSGVDCPADAVEPSTTVCRVSDGVCDPAEYCDGAAVECPVDAVEPDTTVCRASDGVCDPAEYCDGAGDTCPADEVEPATTLCRASGGVCDLDDYCDGSGDACPTDAKDSTTVCRESTGVCDAAEICDGVNNDCPADLLAAAGTVCEPSGTGDVICDPPEVCDGASADCPGPPEANIAPEGTPCGNQSTTACTEPDTCDDAGFCDNNNKVCGSVTNSALCEYDMEPTKGTCNGGLANGDACVIYDACQLGGGNCDFDDLAASYLCTGGTEDGQECVVPTEDACESGGGSCFNGQCSGGSYDGTACCIDGGGICEQSDQFRLLFSPDVQNWTAYRLDASNPGQTYYNVIYDASAAGESDVTLTVTVPYPYVTVGGMPLHVYDDVALDGLNCYVPGEAIMSEPMFITLDDWINGADGVGDYNLHCDQINDPGGSGFCSFDVFIPNAAIPQDGLLYVNVHLDYALKGRWIDANPVGMWEGSGTLEDRYDRAARISPWSSSDALVNTSSNDGPLGIADCSPYWFEHTDDVNAGVCVGGLDGGLPCELDNDTCEGEGVCEAVPLFDDSVENLNVFKKISGVFGRVSCSDNGAGYAYYLDLVRAGDGVVDQAQADDEGAYIFTYRHKGKPTTYAVNLYEDNDRTILLATAELILQGNGWWEVSFTASDCGDEALELWTPSVIYGSGKYRKKK